jgi:hypothetical protein
VAREFFRIVRGSRPVLEDFVPLGATGRVLRFPEYRREFEEGISVYDDFDHACAMARKNRFRQGRFLVKLVVPDDGSVELKQTFAEHHYTLYAKPEQILSYAEPVAVPILATLGD